MGMDRQGIWVQIVDRLAIWESSVDYGRSAGGSRSLYFGNTVVKSVYNYQRSDISKDIKNI